MERGVGGGGHYSREAINWGMAIFWGNTVFTEQLEILFTALRQKYAMFKLTVCQKGIGTKKEVNIYISCLPSSVYSPATMLLAVSRLLEELLFTFLF